MKSVDDLVKGWFAKAQSDLGGARIVIAGSGPYDTACFHCQQAAEKYMKGFLSWRGQAFPFTHDLRLLARACDALEPALNLTVPDVIALTDYAVQLRYDNNFWPSQQQAADALAVAERVRSSPAPRGRNGRYRRPRPSGPLLGSGPAVAETWRAAPVPRRLTRRPATATWLSYLPPFIPENEERREKS